MDPRRSVRALIDEYAYLWSDPGARYVLVWLETADAPLIWDKELRSVLVIEDDALHREVAERMRESGVPVLTDLP